jgi:3alpha(or 20beta)-hydroxysteroid dehydrogenase
MGRLDGKVALITGAARGLGASHAKSFVEEGAKVIITDVLEEEGQKMAEEIGNNAIFLKLDVTKPEEWKNVVEKAEAEIGEITVLVNNAGLIINEPTLEVTVENFTKAFEVNQLGTLLGTQAVIPSMQKAGIGSIINISSASGIVGQAEAAGYNATKFAVRGLTKTIAAEFGPDNIRANSVHPGPVETDMTSQEEVKELIDQIVETIPLDRLGEPQEITDLVVYLASDESSYSTGPEFIVDGGLVNVS